MMKNLFGTAVFALAAVFFTPASALAMSFDDISGKWCGETTAYYIGRNSIDVTFFSNNSRVRYMIDNFEYTDTEITINWFSKDDRVFTKFGEFSSDKQKMVQLQNTAGPRREFRRCS